MTPIQNTLMSRFLNAIASLGSSIRLTNFTLCPFAVTGTTLEKVSYRLWDRTLISPMRLRKFLPSASSPRSVGYTFGAQTYTCNSLEELLNSINTNAKATRTSRSSAPRLQLGTWYVPPSILYFVLLNESKDPGRF